MAKVLISGGSGLLGSNLSKNLHLHGHEVIWLSRNPKQNLYPSFHWNPHKDEIDLKCLDNTDAIINLAGSGIAEKKWTVQYKQEIKSSRINSTRLLFDSLQNYPNQVKTFIGASAVGIYGNTGVKNVKEDSPASDTFLANVCKEWESETLKFNDVGIRTGIVRIGVVLTRNGGFLKKIKGPASWGFGAPLGNGQMQLPWIHIDDLSRIIIHLLETPSLQGVYNAVAPKPVSNEELTKIICKVLKRPQWMPAVPEFILKLVFGELSEIILSDQTVSANKIIQSGFKFQFPESKSAVEDLLSI